MKGISTLLASVLLIAFTVAIATIVFSFYSSTIQSSTETVTNKTATAVDCSSASINIEDVFITGTTSATARVIVKNNGFADLTIQDAQFINKTGHNFTTSNVPLTGFNKGSIAALVFTNVNVSACPAGFSKVLVTTNCGGVSDIFDGTPKCG